MIIATAGQGHSFWAVPREVVESELLEAFKKLVDMAFWDMARRPWWRWVDPWTRMMLEIFSNANSSMKLKVPAASGAPLPGGDGS